MFFKSQNTYHPIISERLSRKERGSIAVDKESKDPDAFTSWSQLLTHKVTLYLTGWRTEPHRTAHNNDCKNGCKKIRKKNK